MPFVFADTTTERVDFRKVFAGSIKFPKAYQLTLNEARQKICDTLASQPSSQSLLDVIEEYIPHVLTMIGVAEKDKLVEVEFTWKSVMTVGIISGLGAKKSSEKRSFSIKSIYFEAIYLMLAYSFGIANVAGKKVGSQVSLASEATLNEAVEMYTKAAGILSMLSVTWATRWNGPSTKSRPPEVTPAGLQALSDFMLLEAQLLTVSKAEKRGMSVSTLTKLQRGALEKFETVKSQLRQAKGDWSDSFLDYIDEGALLVQAMMLKKYAAHCHSEDKNGMAIACMNRSYNIFTGQAKPFKTASWAKVFADHKDEMKQLLDTYVRINNHVTYEKIPNEEDMNAALPAATSLVEKKGYVMPEATEIPEPTEEELAAATAKAKISEDEKPKSPTQKSATASKIPSPPPEEGAKPEGPKASVRDAFKSLLKTDKRDLQ